MFILSQCILHKYNVSKIETISTYSIALGLVFYSCIYLYVLFYNPDSISIFNKFIIYIVGVDLLLSTFYYNMNKIQSEEVNTPLLHQNVEETDSDEYSETDDFFESIYDEAEDADDELEAEDADDELEAEDADDELEAENAEEFSKANSFVGDDLELENAVIEVEEIDERELEEIKNIKWGQSEEIMCLDNDDFVKEDEKEDEKEVEKEDDIIIDIENEIKDETITVIEIKKEKSKKNKSKRGRPSKQTVITSLDGEVIT